MPKSYTISDTERTYALRTYALSLTCGKCGKGQLVASDPTSQEIEIPHTCTHCQREQLISGEAYPRTITRKEFVSDRIIKHVELIPDKEPDQYTPEEVSMLPQDKKVELLQTTRNPVIVDYLETSTIDSVHHTLDSLLEVLFDMAKEAAVFRASGLLPNQVGAPLTMKQVNEMSMTEVTDLIGITNLWPTNVDLVRNKAFGVLDSYAFRSALYKAAREVVIMRDQITSPPTPEAQPLPAKNKGGRPRKVVTA